MLLTLLWHAGGSDDDLGQNNTQPWLLTEVAKEGSGFVSGHFPSLLDWERVILADERLAKQLQAEFDAEFAAIQDPAAADSQIEADRRLAEQLELGLALQLFQEQELPGPSASSLNCLKLTGATIAADEVAAKPEDSEAGSSQDLSKQEELASAQTPNPFELSTEASATSQMAGKADEALKVWLQVGVPPLGEPAQVTDELREAKVGNQEYQLCAICLEHPSTAGFVHGRRWAAHHLHRCLMHFVQSTVHRLLNSSLA